MSTTYFPAHSFGTPREKQAEDAKAFSVRLLDANGDERVLPLPTGTTTIGAGPKCSLRLNQVGADPLQCVIRNSESCPRVWRWSSAAQLNGQSFTESELHPGDRLTLGDFDLILEAIEESASVSQRVNDLLAQTANELACERDLSEPVDFEGLNQECDNDSSTPPLTQLEEVNSDLAELAESVLDASDLETAESEKSDAATTEEPDQQTPHPLGAVCAVPSRLLQPWRPAGSASDNTHNESAASPSEPAPQAEQPAEVEPTPLLDQPEPAAPAQASQAPRASIPTPQVIVNETRVWETRRLAAGRLKRLMAKLREQQALLAASDEKLEESKSQNAELAELLKAARQEVADAAQQSAQLAEELSSLQAEIAAAQQQNESLQQSISEAEASRDGFCGEVARLEQELRTRDAEKSENDERIAQLEASIAQLEQHLVASTALAEGQEETASESDSQQVEPQQRDASRVEALPEEEINATEEEASAEIVPGTIEQPSETPLSDEQVSSSFVTDEKTAAVEETEDAVTEASEIYGEDEPRRDQVNLSGHKAVSAEADSAEPAEQPVDDTPLESKVESDPWSAVELPAAAELREEANDQPADASPENAAEQLWAAEQDLWATQESKAAVAHEDEQTEESSASDPWAASETQQPSEEPTDSDKSPMAESIRISEVWDIESAGTNDSSAADAASSDAADAWLASFKAEAAQSNAAEPQQSADKIVDAESAAETAKEEATHSPDLERAPGDSQAEEAANHPWAGEEAAAESSAAELQAAPETAADSAEEPEEVEESETEWPETDEALDPTIEESDQTQAAAAEEPATDFDEVAVQSTGHDTLCGAPPLGQTLLREAIAGDAAIPAVSQPAASPELEPAANLPVPPEEHTEEFTEAASEAPTSEAVNELGPAADANIDALFPKAEVKKDGAAAESFIDKYASMLPDDDDPVEAVDHAVETAPSPMEAMIEESEVATDDSDDSIENYMAGLMSRIRGEAEAAGSTTFSTPAKSASPVSSPKVERPAEPTVEKDNTPLKNLESLRRGPAPEQGRDMTALRELANQSARKAINTASSKQNKEAAMVNIGISAVACVCGGYLASQASNLISAQFVGGLAAFACSLVWGFRTLKLMMPSKGHQTQQAKAQPQVEAPQQA